MKNRTTRWLTAIGMLALVVGLFLGAAACGGGSSASEEATADGDEAAHEEGDDHDADATDMDMDMGEEGAEANSYLEAAPKDALYLVEMTNFAFTPSVLEVNAGEVLEIAIQNIDPVLHDFTIDAIDADVHVSYLGGTGEHAHAEADAVEADVHFALTEPGTGVVHLNIHEPGEYIFYCTVPGHREAGMEGTLIVSGEAHDEDAMDDMDEEEEADHNADGHVD